MTTRRAYCSACDRNVPVKLKPGAELEGQPSPRDARALVCLDYGVRCTGWLCPLFSIDEADGPAATREEPPEALPPGPREGPPRGPHDRRAPPDHRGPRDRRAARGRRPT